MSSSREVSVTVDWLGKGTTPKWCMCRACAAGRKVKSLATVIARWGATH